jgi:hypothetical protein
VTPFRRITRLRDDFEPPQWDIPGWDWEEDDYAWLSSRSGIHKDGTSIFFIHGGRIRHQAHIPHGNYSVDEFCQMVRERAEALDDADLWVEGTRPPNEDDLLRLQAARDRQRRHDDLEARELRRRRPDLF